LRRDRRFATTLDVATHRKQHFLPVFYLKQFSDGAEISGRRGLVWRVDREQTKRVPIESQCVGNWFYSKDAAATTERVFQEGESFYAELWVAENPSRWEMIEWR